MKKDSIESGYVVELRNETLYVRIGERLLAEDSWMDFQSYTEELDYNHLPDEDFLDSYDIIRVYKMKPGKCTSLGSMLDRENLILLWDRFREIDWKAIPKMTDIKLRPEGSTDEHIESKFIAYIGDGEKEPFLVQNNGNILLVELSVESYENLVEISKKEGK